MSCIFVLVIVMVWSLPYVIITLEQYQHHTIERIKTFRKLTTVYFFYTSYNVLIIANLIDIFPFSNPPNFPDRTLAYVHAQCSG